MSNTAFHECLRTPEAARYIGISASRLSQFRMTGEGPPYVKVGQRAVAYRRRDLDAWMESRLRLTTAGN